MSDVGAAHRVSGIVLAGGASRRFGTDKLAATVDGRPMLELAIASVAAVSAEVIVVVAPGDDRPLPVDAVPVPVRRAEDPETHGGPLVGLLAGLEAAREPIALVAGGDMPTLSVDVLHALVRALVASEGKAEAAILVRHGMDRPLPAAVRNGAATQAARRVLGEGERSLVALFRTLETRRIAEADWRGLDPSGETLRDVDTPADLQPT
jgi:molybdopterin-guanine dinucleotide biosynthesis protein A